MKRITFFMTCMSIMTCAVMCLSACFGTAPVEPNDAIHYINVDCRVVEKSKGSSGGRNVVYEQKYFLVQLLSDTTMYTEWRGPYGYGVYDSVYYSTNMGDTVHFDYIRKNRFWRMKR